jgi:hypothetical protein
MTIMQRLRAKQKADAARAAEKAEKHRTARIAKKVARAAAKDDGLNDLPLAVALAIELNPAQPVKPELSAPVPMDDSVPGIVARLTAIREKIWSASNVRSELIARLRDGCKPVSYFIPGHRPEAAR